MGKKSETERHHDRRAAELRLALSTGIGFVRVYEAAAIFGVSRQSLWEWVQAGRLPKPTRVNAHVSGWPAGIIRDAIHGKAA